MQDECDTERVTKLGDGQLVTYIDEHLVRIVVDDTLSITTNAQGYIDIVADLYLNWTLSKIEMCTFIKILIDKFDLPMTAIEGDENESSF